MAKRKNPVPVRKTPEPSGRPRFVRQFSWIIFAAGFLLYANTLLHNYALDDAIVIYDNEFTTKGLAGIPGLLKYDTFRGFFKEEGKETLVSGGRYRPLTPVMYAAEVQMLAPVKKDAEGQKVLDKDGDPVYDPNEGGKLNAVKFTGHLINVILYGFSGVMLFWLLLLMLSPGQVPAAWQSYAPFVALAATLLFVVHPVHTEVVANVKGRDEILSLLGSLAALYFSLRSFYEKKPLLNLLGALLFFLALFSKENAITFLAVIPLAYYFFTKAGTRSILSQTAPYLLLGVAFVLIRGSIIGWNLGGDPPRELMNNPFLKLVGTQYVDFTFGEKFATIFYTLGKYVKLLLIPYPLSHDYYPRAVQIMHFTDWQVLVSLLLYLGAGVYALVRLPRKDPVSFALLFYLGTLFLVSNIPFPIGTNMSERFLYMPSVGFCMLVALVVHPFLKRTGVRQGVISGGILILVLFSALTVLRNRAWKDNFALFTTDVKTVPNSAKIRNATGGELIAQSLLPENEPRKTQMLTQAVEHLNEAIRIHPGYKNPFLLLGNAYNYLKNYEASIQSYQQAIKLDPNYKEAYSNLGITYRDAGRYYGEQKGDLNKSLEFLQKAYEALPEDYETLRLLGVAYGIGGQPQIAVSWFEKALERAPNDADALYNLGSALYNAGQPERGEAFLQQALQVNPNIAKERQERQ